jgi:anaerobic dimethyl sulfoxide reductase subunit C (anchor subunit)
MHSTEWSLIFFTTISQLATGIMIAVFPFVFAKKLKKYARMNQTALYFATGLMVVALVLSFLHLNNPVNSVYALSNLESSWLSREILFVSLFLFFLLLVNLILYFKKPKVNYYRTFILFTTIMGIIMVYSMSKLYIIPTVPPWNSIATLIAFYSTALLLGAAFVMGLSFIYNINTNNKILKRKKTQVLVVFILLAIAALLINTLFLRHTVPEGNVGFEPHSFNKSFMVVRWVTLGLGALSLLYIIYSRERFKNLPILFFLPTVFFLASELIARAAFYASFYNIGL